MAPYHAIAELKQTVQPKNLNCVPQLDVHTRHFQLKLSKCCHEVLIDKVGDRVVLPEKW